MNMSTGSQARKAYILAKRAGLISRGWFTKEYDKLLVEATGKERMTDMTYDEAESFLEALSRRQKTIGLGSRAWRNIGLWILICGIIAGSLLAIDYFTAEFHRHAYYPDSNLPAFRSPLTGQYPAGVEFEEYYTHSFSWSPLASIIIVVLGFYIAVTNLVYHHTKESNRNTVAWTTAFLVFSPVLAGIAYLLTWPKKLPHQIEWIANPKQGPRPTMENVLEERPPNTTGNDES